MFEAIASNQTLVGLAVIVAIVSGIPIIFSAARKSRIFLKDRQYRAWEIYRRFQDRVVRAAVLAKDDNIFFTSIIWLKMSRSLKHALYFLFVLSVMAFVRAANRLGTQSEFIETAARFTLPIILIVTGMIVLTTLFEISKICKLVSDTRSDNPIFRADLEDLKARLQAGESS